LGVIGAWVKLLADPFNMWKGNKECLRLLLIDLGCISVLMILIMRSIRT